MMRRDAFAAAGSTAVRSAGRLAAMVSVARLGGVDGVAFVTLCVTVEIIVISALNALFAGPAAVLCPGRRSDLRRLIHRVAERSQLLVGMLVSGVGLGVLAFSGIGAESGVAAVLFVLYLSVAAAFQAKRSTRISEFHARPVLAWELAIAAAAVGAPVGSTIWSGDPVAWFWGGQLLVQLVAVLSLSVGRHPVAAGARVRRVARRSLLSTGWKMLAGSVAVSLAGRTQPLIIAVLLGPVGVGMYGAANAFGAPLRMAVASVRGVVLPRFAKAHRGGGVAIATVRPGWIFGGAGAVVAGVGVSGLVAPWLLGGLFGSEFVSAAPLVPLVVLHAIIASAGAILATLRQAEGQSGRCAAIRWCAAAATPPLMWVGGMTGGVPGLLLALVVSELAVVASLWRIGIARVPRPTRRGMFPSGDALVSKGRGSIPGT